MLLPGKTLPNSNRPSRSVGAPRKTTIRHGFPWGPEVIGTNSREGSTHRFTIRVICDPLGLIPLLPKIPWAQEGVGQVAKRQLRRPRLAPRLPLTIHGHPR